jgi:hypothetical protein
LTKFGSSAGRGTNIVVERKDFSFGFPRIRMRRAPPARVFLV